MLFWIFISLKKMVVKAGLLLITLLVGSLALPLNEEQDMSFFFDYPASSPRIIGGSSAGTVRHMVALSTGVYTRTFTCGGSLITSGHVLTAAHCIQNVFSNGALLNSLRGTVGTNRWNWFGTQYRFSGNITHPNYVHLLIKNDLGILITSTSVVQNNNIQTVPISYDFVGGGVAAVVNGWGRTRTGGSISSTLMELRPTVIDGDRCVADVARRAAEINMAVPVVLPNIQICAFLSANSGTCHGDSGSALIRQSNGQQIGVVSWGLPCARNAPDMFVRLSAYRSWIEQSTR